jgi:hypothetical protein
MFRNHPGQLTGDGYMKKKDVQIALVVLSILLTHYSQLYTQNHEPISELELKTRPASA